MKRASALDFDTYDLEAIILGCLFPYELDQTITQAPGGALVYMAHGWTRSGHYLEVGYASPDYGGGYYVIHAMLSRRPPGR
jgi:hypothetical protein